MSGLGVLTYGEGMTLLRDLTARDFVLSCLSQLDDYPEMVIGEQETFKECSRQCQLHTWDVSCFGEIQSLMWNSV
jgi:hypothetical protein